MNRAEAQLEIQRLTSLIHHHNELYHQQGRPVISDYEFDQLVEQLARLESQFPEFLSGESPTQTVGEKSNKNFNTVYHRYPMLSLGNTYSEEELLQFIQRSKKLLPGADMEFFCELKFDGIAISLSYEDGVLRRVATRGDGLQGDDITLNGRTIAHIPQRIQMGDLPKHFEVRGEAIMPRATFEALNISREKRGEALLANPRNTTAGTLKMLDSSLVAERSIEFYPYSVIMEGGLLHTHEEGIQLLEKCGFRVSSTYKKCGTVQEVMDYINHWEIHKPTLPVDIDGVVIKINSVADQERLGNTAKGPRWAIAYKYKPENLATKLQRVVYQVGRTGAVTPVAHLEPILLAGTMVKRASLHNAGEIKRLGLYSGDTVLVEKGGDIIPKVTGVVAAQRSSCSKPITFITNCPACSAPLVQEDAVHYCVNEKSCPPQLIARLRHFVSRKAMHIDSIGEKTIALLFERGLVQTPADLYTLGYDDLCALEGFQELSAKNLLRGIALSKKMPFAKVLFALGIRHVGETIAEQLTQYFQDIDALVRATKEALVEVPEIGEKIAHSVVAYFQDPDYQGLVAALQAAGLQFRTIEEATSTGEKPLLGKSFVVSGTFDIARELLKRDIKEQGGRLLTNVSKSVDYLVAGRKVGPAKLAAAQALQVTVLSESEVMSMLAAGV